MPRGKKKLAEQIIPKLRESTATHGSPHAAACPRFCKCLIPPTRLSQHFFLVEVDIRLSTKETTQSYPKCLCGDIKVKHNESHFYDGDECAASKK